MDRMTAVRDLAVRETFRLRGYGIDGDALAFGLNEAVISLRLTEEEERVFRASVDTATLLLGTPTDPTPQLRLILN